MRAKRISRGVFRSGLEGRRESHPRLQLESPGELLKLRMPGLYPQSRFNCSGLRSGQQEEGIRNCGRGIADPGPEQLSPELHSPVRRSVFIPMTLQSLGCQEMLDVSNGTSNTLRAPGSVLHGRSGFSRSGMGWRICLSN